MRCSIVAAAILLFIPLSVVAAPIPSESRTALDSTLPQIDLNNTHLSDALDFLAKTTNANILVDWKALDAVKVEKDTPITLSLHEVRTEKVLSEILDQAGGGALTYYVDDNVVEITTKTVADQKLVTVCYDVTDLISLDDSFNGTLSGGISLSGGGSGGGGASNLSSNSGSSNSSGQTPAQKADQLVQLIKTTIRPEIWKDHGGPATIDYFNGLLIVTAPRSVHQAINGELE
jgi:hypothetical protein